MDRRSKLVMIISENTPKHQTIKCTYVQMIIYTYDKKITTMQHINY